MGSFYLPLLGSPNCTQALTGAEKKSRPARPGFFFDSFHRALLRKAKNKEVNTRSLRSLGIPNATNRKAAL